MAKKLTDSAIPPLNLSRVLHREWLVWLPGCILAFFAASIAISGWPNGLIPNLTYPYTYNNDGLLHSWLIQRIIESGWYFNDARSGYPFGSTFLDFPGSDTGHVLILKFIAFFTKTYPATLNFYFLLGFSVTYIFAYGVFRTFGLMREYAICGAVLFIFLPFHFVRLVHLYYTWYFVIPIFFYFAYILFSRGGRLFIGSHSTINWILYPVVFVALSCFGVYYALFGVIILAVSSVLGAVNQRNKKTLIYGGFAITFVVLGVLINVMPNIAYMLGHGVNAEMAHRSAIESEIYGLNLASMLFPHSGPSSLGAIGAAGILLMFGTISLCFSNYKNDSRINFLSLIFFVLFSIATIGGFSYVFAVLITPLIRAWNRVSIFIGFAALAVFLLYLQNAINRFFPKAFIRLSMLLFAMILMAFGVWNQTPASCVQCQQNIKLRFLTDQKFISDIEKNLPKGAAIYQLPYMPFPETPPLHKLEAYDLAIGFLHSKNLRWNYAGTKGRVGDLFYRYLASEPIEKQIEVIKRLGFAGIYIDRRGYADNGKAIEKVLNHLLGEESKILHPSGIIAFYKFEEPGPIIEGKLKPSELMQLAGFTVDKYGIRYSATLEDGLDFRKPGLPTFVTALSGLSGSERWGRWSDANLHRTVQIQLASQLPSTFTITLIAHGFGPNITQPTIVRIGKQDIPIYLTAEPKEYHITFENIGPSLHTIEIIPPYPTSPAELGQGQDVRKLGIGIQQIRFK